jgi:ribosomal protein S10
MSGEVYVMTPDDKPSVATIDRRLAVIENQMHTLEQAVRENTTQQGEMWKVIREGQGKPCSAHEQWQIETRRRLTDLESAKKVVEDRTAILQTHTDALTALTRSLGELAEKVNSLTPTEKDITDKQELKDKVEGLLVGRTEVVKFLWTLAGGLVLIAIISIVGWGLLQRDKTNELMSVVKEMRTAVTQPNAPNAPNAPNRPNEPNKP